MNSLHLKNTKPGDIVWLDARLDKKVVEIFCQKPRIMPGARAGLPNMITAGENRHFVILLEKDFSIQKAFHAANDFDVKVLSPTLGVFWVPCNYLLTLEEYKSSFESSKEKEKNKKKSATK